MPGPLTQSPLSGAFWRQMGSGLHDAVSAPIARDVMAGHQSFKQNYPLPYEVAQVALPPVGIAAAGLDYAEAARDNDSQGMARAALSAIPVVGRSFRVGNAVPSLRQAVSAVPQQHGLALTNPVMGATFKAGAAENVTQMGEAAYRQDLFGTRRREENASQ